MKKSEAERLQDAQNVINKTESLAAADSCRPVYHAICPANWMNDPNGPIVWKNEIHVFYQHNPFATTGGKMFWGHMKSSDMIHWNNLPIAFGPSEEKKESGCWSGCCVIGPENKPTAIYTSVSKPNSHIKDSEQWIVIGSDDMVKWVKPSVNPVMTQKIHKNSGYSIRDWRDPYAWKGEDGQYYCVLGGSIEFPRKIRKKMGKDTNAATFLYQSPDLIHWTFLSPLTTRYTGEMEVSHETRVNLSSNFECPNFFPLGDKWVLMVSPNGPVSYTVGSFVNNKFTPNMWRIFDGNAAFYAPNSFRDPQGRQIIIGWLRTPQYASWISCFTLPRVVTLDGEDQLKILPIPEVSTLHMGHFRKDSLNIPADAPINLTNIILGSDVEQFWVKNQVEIQFIVVKNAKNSRVGSFGIELFNNLGLGFMNSIGYDEDAKFFYTANNGCVLPDKDITQDLKVRIFIDHVAIEIFLNDHLCLTHSVKLSPEDRLKFEISALDSDLTLKNLEIWGMKSIGA